MRLWTKISRAGFDSFRDAFNTYAFFKILSPVKGLRGLDIGCRGRHNTRLLAKKDAKVTGIDLSDVFIKHAQEEEQKNPLGIIYKTADAASLPLKITPLILQLPL
jgi:2-polyprenyl-3-methyl-5-hydroxy-6-metoxy-1,4-benzoquinol methylase